VSAGGGSLYLEINVPHSRVRARCARDRAWNPPPRTAHRCIPRDPPPPARAHPGYAGYSDTRCTLHSARDNLTPYINSEQEEAHAVRMLEVRPRDTQVRKAARPDALLTLTLTLALALTL
jgi:hypothetical protein